MYVHATGLAMNGPLAENDRVSFASEVDRRTNKPKAVKVVLSAAVEAPAPPAEEEPVAESLVETIMESVRDELDVYEIKIRAEAFQRARLATQLRMAAAEALASRVAEERRLEEEAIAASAAAEAARIAAEAEAARIAAAAEAARRAAEVEAARISAKAETFQRARLASQLKQAEVECSLREAEEMRLCEEAAAEAEAARIAAEAEAARIAAEAEAARIAEEAEAARIAAEAEAARIAAEAEAARIAAEAEAARIAAEAEAARIAAEAEAARIAAEAATEEEEARAFGYPSLAIMKARMQPKSPEEEALLAAKYGAMDLGEKAFAFLTVSCRYHLGTLFSLLLVFCFFWLTYFSHKHISLDQ